MQADSDTACFYADKVRREREKKTRSVKNMIHQWMQMVNRDGNARKYGEQIGRRLTSTGGGGGGGGATYLQDSDTSQFQQSFRPPQAWTAP
ncbi:unnamed protein product [Chondrus crispus]|uniref:Uncharacterized protein n=1 Tax=Chondrus crispus TaxID=2769 RepID=R7QTF6_CHOCR|nr:unnamed protein product [Chondrus crispus]CDF40796.1 unnamed protein product [Chondrus crispus]|eukprot:XP_005711090.1 unnamed protein product [Chondrus crispus]